MRLYRSCLIAAACALLFSAGAAKADSVGPGYTLSSTTLSANQFAVDLNVTGPGFNAASSQFAFAIGNALVPGNVLPAQIQLFAASTGQLLHGAVGNCVAGDCGPGVSGPITQFRYLVTMNGTASVQSSVASTPQRVTQTSTPAISALTVAPAVTSTGTEGMTAATPEPASLALIATGLLGVAGLVKRRRQ